MTNQIKLIGGPADGRRAKVNGDPDEYVAKVRPRPSAPPDPSHPSRHRGRQRRRGQGMERHRYRRTSRGVGTALIPRRYEYMAVAP